MNLIECLICVQNNNQNSATLDQIQTKTSSTKAEQTNKNMVMITVPPSGPPVVVPIGRQLPGKFFN